MMIESVINTMKGGPFRRFLAVAPPLLAIVGLGLSVYALVDFSSFKGDYDALIEEVGEQSQQDFDFLYTQVMQKFYFLLSSFIGTESCTNGQTNPFLLLRELAADVPEMMEALKRITTAVLPSGPIWEDYLINLFPAIDGVDYSRFVNPARTPTLLLYGVPDMDPLFRTFQASLVVDIVGIAIIFLPLILYHFWPALRDRVRVERALLGLDVVLFIASMALLLATLVLSDSERGYGVYSVRGRVVLIETSMWNEFIKSGINSTHWGKIPQKYCRNSLEPCFPEYSYQQDCFVANVEVTASADSLVQHDNQWFVNLEATGVSIMEHQILSILQPLFNNDEKFIDGFNSSLGYQLQLTEEMKSLIIQMKNSLFVSACPTEQKIFSTDKDMKDVSYPSDSPDYNFVCNANCENGDLHEFSTLETCPECFGPHCGCHYEEYTSCSMNCPTVDTSECGCNSFNFGIWEHNCTTHLPAITEQNYNKFTSFAIENVRGGLKYDIAATILDFVAICLTAISIFLSSSAEDEGREEDNKRVEESDEAARNQPRISTNVDSESVSSSHGSSSDERCDVTSQTELSPQDALYRDQGTQQDSDSNKCDCDQDESLRDEANVQSSISSPVVPGAKNSMENSSASETTEQADGSTPDDVINLSRAGKDVGVFCSDV